MTVKHLQTIQRQQLNAAVATDPIVVTKFRSGFSECAGEVSRYVSQLENVDPIIKQRLLNHLNNCICNLQQVPPFYSHYVPYIPENLLPEVKVGFQNELPSGDENNNGSSRIQMSNEIQLVPSRLSSGQEIALLVPPSSRVTGHFPLYTQIPDTSSRIASLPAFTPTQRTHSPLLSPSTSTSSFEESRLSEQYPSSMSPVQRQVNYKICEQIVTSSNTKSISSETQKPQISSSSDRKSPKVSTEIKFEINSTSIKKDIERYELNSPIEEDYISPLILRQPLSVITDKAYNKTFAITRRDGLKRHYSDWVSISCNKKPRYQECSNLAPSTSSFAIIRFKDECTDYNEAISDKTHSKLDNFPQNQITKFDNSEGSSTTNGDMWRPW